MHFDLEKSTSVLHNIVDSGYRTQLHSCLCNIFKPSIKLPCSECVLVASVYLTSNDGCSLFIPQTQVVQHRVGLVLWEGRKLTKGGSVETVSFKTSSVEWDHWN